MSLWSSVSGNNFLPTVFLRAKLEFVVWDRRDEKYTENKLSVDVK
jgi:hypothetical protein